MVSFINYQSVLEMSRLSNSTLTLLQRFDSKFDESILAIVDFDNSIQRLSKHLDKMIEVQTIKYRGADDVGRGNISGRFLQFEDQSEQYEGIEPITGENKMVDFLKLVQSVSKVGNQVIDLSGAFGELPASVSNLKNIFGHIESISESAGGIAENLFSLKNEFAVSTAVATVSEIMTFVSGIAEAMASFGPPGWVAGLAALALGTAVSSNVSEETSMPAYSVDPLETWKVFEEEERKNDYEKLIVLYDVKTVQQLDEVKQELDSDYLVADRGRRVDSQLLDWQKNLEQSRFYSTVEFPGLGDKWLKPDKEVSDEYVRKTYFPFLPAPLTKAQKLAKEVDELKSIYRFDSFWGPVDNVKLNKEIAALQKKYKPDKEPVYRLATEEEWEESKHRRGQLSVSMRPKEWNGNGGGVALSRQGIRGHSAMGAGGRTVNINLNKPMIENFTIYTKYAKESAKDFKHKVEEVLLEILNSENAF